MKALIKLALTALVLHATWRAGSVYLRHFEFKDDVRELSQFSDRRSLDDLRSRIMEAAARNQIPVEADAIEIRRQDNHTYVNATYTEQVELVPTYFYPWTLQVNVDTFTYVGK